MRSRVLLFSGLFTSLLGCDPKNIDVKEFEPNDTPGQAKNVGDPAGKEIRVGASIAPPGDVDFFKFTVSATADVKLETFDKFGVDCKNVDTRLELLDTDGNTILAQNDDVIPFQNTCSLIDPSIDAGAQGLRPGEYFAKVVAVNETVQIPAYQLKISFTALCGDGTPQGSEACDDGNNVAGDGCNEFCIADLCGNRIVDAGEDCDDGKECTDGTDCTTDILLCAGIGDGTCLPRNGDGCSNACLDETNLPICGDGAKEGNEECDDGNTIAGDGCSPGCLIENAQCGNGVLEGNEECEDGNTTPGDGCNANCNNEPGHFGELEPNNTTELFGFKDVGAPTVVIHGALDPEDDLDVYRFTVSVTSDVKIEVFDGTPPATTCFGAVDSAIELIAPDGDTLLASDDENSASFCSKIDSSLSPGARGLVPGDYFVRIREFGQDEVVPEYQLKISFNAVCGNNIVEGSETCDENQPVPISEDGCSAQCQAEPGQSYEVEPNNELGSNVKDLRDDGTANQIPIDSLMHANIDPAGDVDIYEFRPNVPISIIFETFDSGGPGVQPTGCLNQNNPALDPDGCIGLDTFLEIFEFDATNGDMKPLLDANNVPITDDDRGPLLCSCMPLTLPPGLYQLRVSEFNAQATAAYTMRITVN